jgi:multiple sugar transport system permease protein
MIVGNPRTKQIFKTSRYTTLILGAVVMVLPFAYMVSTSFKKRTFLFQNPPQFIPSEPTTRNYIDAWSSSHFSKYFLNSLIVATSSTVITVTFAAMSAYAFARFNFFGKKPLFIALLLGLMVPTIVMIIPQFIIAKKLHLVDSLIGLIFFYIGGNFALNTFLLRGFMEEIPVELEDSMKVEGANAWTRFVRLYLPLSRPALGTVALFSFLGSWDEFAWAVTLINSEDKRTLPIGIALFHGAHATSWGLVFAASIIALVPVVIVFLAAQRHFIQGLSVGGVKG